MSSTFQGTTNPRRDIPAVRVAKFFDDYMVRAYGPAPTDGTYDGRLEQFAFEAGVAARSIYRIRSGENANVRFDWFDGILARLDHLEFWHLDPEDGGFADYYGDSPAPAATSSIKQTRERVVQNAKRCARNAGDPGGWGYFLIARAEEDFAQWWKDLLTQAHEEWWMRFLEDECAKLEELSELALCA